MFMERKILWCKLSSYSATSPSSCMVLCLLYLKEFIFLFSFPCNTLQVEFSLKQKSQMKTGEITGSSDGKETPHILRGRKEKDSILEGKWEKAQTPDEWSTKGHARVCRQIARAR